MIFIFIKDNTAAVSRTAFAAEAGRRATFIEKG